MTRPSALCQEWAVTTPVQPDLTQAPTGYRLQALPVSITDTGALYVPPATFDLAEAPEDERENILVAESVVVTPESIRYTNRLEFSDRALMPIRWETIVHDEALDEELGSLDWLAVGAEAGTGAAMNMNERWFERWDDPDLALHHNPNLGGAGFSGVEHLPTTPMRSYGGKMIMFEVTNSMQRACVAPMDFGGDPDGNDTFSNHGGDDHEHPLWWPKVRQFWQNDLNYQGDQNIHRRTFWQYSPVELNNDGISAPLLAYMVAASGNIGHTFTKAYIVNLTNAVTTEISGFGTLHPTNMQIWDVSKSRYVKDGSTVLGNPGPVPEGYVAIILHDEATGMAVAYAGKLSDTDGGDPNIFTASEIRAPNYVSIQQHPDQGTADRFTNIVTAVNFISKSHVKRKAGWIGHQHFLITGLFTEVEGAMVRLAVNGWLDDDLADPPASATVGTTFPTPASPTVPALVEVPTLVGVGGGQLAASNSDWWRNELDADLGKAGAADPLDPDSPASTLDPSKIIWNDSARRFEALDVFHNASGGSWGNCTPNTFGPQMALAHAFKGRHDACWLLWMAYHGSTLNNVEPQTPASWAEGLVPVSLPAAVTVARVGDGTTATITADSGTPFLGTVAGAAARISGSYGYLEFAEGSATHPLLDYVDADDLGGNNTHEGRPVIITAVNGGGASITVTGVAASGVVYEFANESATLTFDYGPVNLRELAGDTIQRAIAHAITRLRRTLTPKLTVTVHGEDDIGRTEGQYTADLASHIAWLRSEFGIELVASEVPHGIALLTPNTPAGTDEQVEAIRAAQLAVAASEEQCYAVETRKLKLRHEAASTWPEEERSDRGVHFTPASANRLGVMFDEGYALFDDTPALDEDDSAGPVPSDGDAVPLMDPYPGDPDQFIEVDDGGSPVTFIVEDGTGLADAESYCSVDFATAYFQSYGASAEWTAANTTQRHLALRTATEYIDLTYGDRFVGYKLLSTQALEVPRTLAYDRRVDAIQGVPADLQRATCEAARRWLVDPTQLMPDIAAGSNVQSDSVSVGPIHVQAQFGGSRTTSKTFPIIDKYLRLCGLLPSGSWASR